MRVLALDHGAARIGVAVSDERRLTVRPLEAIKVAGWKKDREAIRRLIQEYTVHEIVVGIPINMDGSLGAAAEQVQRFITRLKGVFQLPVFAYDERLSTVEAEEQLRTRKVPRGRRKQLVDSLAATVILQDYLDSTSRKDAG